MKHKTLFIVCLALMLGVFSGIYAQALSGEKTIGSGGTYTTFTAAINALNSNGVGEGGVIFNVFAGSVFAENNPAITATGTVDNPIIFQKTGAGNNPKITPSGSAGTADAGIIIHGGDYITFDGIDINSSAVTAVEHGYIVRNASATNGAQHNIIKNCTITLNRNNSSPAYVSGIVQSSNAITAGAISATAQSGTNDYNRYLNLTIQNSISGIIVYGDTYYERYTDITTTDDTIRNTLTNLGSTYGGQVCGIYIYKGASGTIHNTDITGISGLAGGILAGIYLDLYTGEFDISNNNIRDLQNTHTSSTSYAYGFVSTNVYAGGGTLKIYNNTVSDIRCNNGSTSELRVAGFRFAHPESNEHVFLTNNSISIGYGKTWDYSSAAVINYARTSDVTMQGNIVANYAAITGTSARSYAIWAYTRWLGDYVTDYNLYYCRYGYLGHADYFDEMTITGWQSLIDFGDDDHSVSGDPYFIDPNNNLHATGAKAAGIAGFAYEPWVTVDMDYETRGEPTVIGADSYAPIQENSAILAPITQIPQTLISSIANTAVDAVEVMNFRMVDYGPDGYPTKVTTVKIQNANPYNPAVWTNVLQGAVLKVEGVPIGTATATITNTAITFTIPEGDFNIPEGQTANVTLAIYLKTTGLAEGSELQFKITSNAHGFTNAFWGSRLLEILAADITSQVHYINVVATQLQLTYPARELVNRQFQVIAYPRDANGNLDFNYTGIGTLSLHTGTGTVTGTASTTIAEGDGGWNISYNRVEHIKLQVVSGSITAVTDIIQINPYIEVSSPASMGFESSISWPFIYNKNYGRCVSLYQNAEVNGHYAIEALSWNVVTPTNTSTPLPVKIYIKPYNGTFYGVSSTTWETMITGATLVYNGTVSINTAGWKKINLSTPYNNVGNFQSLMVLVESNWGLYYYPTAPTFAGSYTYAADYQFSTTGNTTPPPSTINLAKDNYRPYVRFYVTTQGYYEDTVTEQSSTETVSANATNQQIIRANVQTGGTLSTQTVQSLTFNTTGTTDPSDITAAKVYYTGASSTFGTTTQYGSTITSFGGDGSFTVSQSMSVNSGDHYFWLVYDIGSNLNVGDHFDAQCTGAVVNNLARTPSITDPAGYRSVAGLKLSNINVSQTGQGTTTSGTTNLSVIRLEFYTYSSTDADAVTSLKLNSIAITGKNTNNADVSAAKLYLGYDMTNQLGSAQTMPSGIANFTGLNYTLAEGTTFVTLYYDISGSAGAGDILDAKIAANSVNVSGSLYPATEQDPSGQYTVQNFNYGGGYAEQGGYYFANTLADPAPSHPTFNWIDISSTGYNAYADITGDDGLAPNNNTGYPIGFSFPFFGTTFTTFWVTADGAICLTKPVLPLPQYQSHKNMIAPFYTDLQPASPNYPKTILYQNVNGNLVITYLKAQPKTSATLFAYATFQVILYPNGKIKMQFLEFGPQMPMNSYYTAIVNSTSSAYHMYGYSGQQGPIAGASPIAVAYGQNAFMLSDTPAQNDLPIPATGTPTITFPNTGATVAFTTSTAATNLTAIRVNTNPGGALPNGILSLANRHWTINSTATSGLGEYDLTLNLTGLANITDISLARLVKREHVLAAWTDLGTPTTFDSGLHTATWHITNGFSDFGIGGDMETTLPVELSLFTAILTAQNKVKLSWVSQSETGLSGYYVYRSISNQLSTAQMISPLIQGTNSSEQHTYQFTDSELFEEGIYYYWLQSYNMDGSSEYYGYVLVNYSLTNNNDIPEIPIVTGLNCIFPNPFNPVTFIAYSLKESSSVTFNIYNSRGQLVRKIDNAPTEEGLHRVQWDGRDNAGKSCSSGLYVIRMLAGKQTFIHKAILMK